MDYRQLNIKLVKISYSKDLLRYSNQTVKEIAVDVGLENYAYFSRLFKKRTGLTPSQYRKVALKSLYDT